MGVLYMSWKKVPALIISLMLCVLAVGQAGSETPETPGGEGTPDYSIKDNWAYYAVGEDRAVDLFLVCPTVDTNDEMNMSMADEQTNAKFLAR